MPRWTAEISKQNAMKKMQSSCADPSHTADVALASPFYTPACWWLQISMQSVQRHIQGKCIINFFSCPCGVCLTSFLNLFLNCFWDSACQVSHYASVCRISLSKSCNTHRKHGQDASPQISQSTHRSQGQSSLIYTIHGSCFSNLFLKSFPESLFLCTALFFPSTLFFQSFVFTHQS